MNIALSKPLFDGQELVEIEKVLASGWVMQGPKVEEFEQLFAAYVGSRWAVAVSSCSTALHLAMSALGVGKGDEVIVPSLTWIATAAAVEECGARAVFCDVETNTFNIDIRHAERLITQRTKAIIAVNLFGLAANLPELKKLASSHGIELIEDAACSLGATVNGRQSGTFGRLGCFSFHPRKSITTGEGGMIVGDSPGDERLLRSLRSHGVRIPASAPTTAPQPYDLGDFDQLGYNYRLTDLQAAVGIAQMRKLAQILTRRREIARIYDRELAGLAGVQLPEAPSGFEHTYQSYVVLITPAGREFRDPESLHELRNRMMIELKNAGVATRPGTHAVHALKYFRDKYGLEGRSLPNAMAVMNQSIALPLHPLLTSGEVSFICSNFKRINESGLLAASPELDPQGV
jgi:perosamine synthetase